VWCFVLATPHNVVPNINVVLRLRRRTRGCGRRCAEAGWPVVSRLCGVPLRLVSACGARVRVGSSDCPVLTAERVNPDWIVSCMPVFHAPKPGRVTPDHARSHPNHAPFGGVTTHR